MSRKQRLESLAQLGQLKQEDIRVLNAKNRNVIPWKTPEKKLKLPQSKTKLKAKARVRRKWALNIAAGVLTLLVFYLLWIYK